MQRSKTYRATAESFDQDAVYSPLEAIKIAKTGSKKKFDETVDVAMRLGVDPRKADQMVRGTVNLPHGTGKTARVLVFANAATQAQAGSVIPAEITIYEDRSFSFVLKTSPTAVLLRTAAGVEKGSAEPHREKVGSVTRDQVREIAETKMPDLNAIDVEGAMKIVEGTARSMGITVAG